MESSDLAVGIDLGTTNSLIGTVLEGEPLLFAIDDAGGELLPSAVSLVPPDELLVGRAARNRRLLDPACTVTSVKRRMGRDETVTLGGRSLTPQQISALILGALLDRAEARLGCRPRRAVLTVPAWFNDAQRQATRDAGEIAGLVVERLVNEPTAAALTHRTGSEEAVLVYDFGGGTFDVSVLERDEELLEVRASKGDVQLGGDDLDQALVELVLERLGERRRVVEREPRALTRLVEAVERAKIALSDETRDAVRLFDPFLAGEGAAAIHLDLPLSREDVEAAARPLVERTLECIDRALASAGMRSRDLDRVLLVGGSSKLPIVRRMVSAHLAMPARADLDADRAVALGAAMLAGRISGAPVSDVLVDITPHSLVAGAADDQTFEGFGDEEPDLRSVVVIPRDVPVPLERKVTVVTIHDDQEEVLIPIAQGELPRLSGNTPLGQASIAGLPPSPAGSPVEVCYRLDLSGVLHVSATHLPSGRRAEVRIADSPYALTEQRRSAERNEVDELRRTSAARASESSGLGTEAGAAEPARCSESDASLARALLTRAGRALETSSESAGGPAAGSARSAASALRAALDRHDPRVAELSDALSDALLDLM